MNIIVQFIVAAVAEMQDRVLLSGSDDEFYLVDAGDEFITALGLSPEDWSDVVTLPSDGTCCDYIHVMRTSLN